jgi:hypothetical protein
MAVITDAPYGEMHEDPSDKRPNKKQMSKAWMAWLHSVFLICFSVQDSGPTVSRPTVELWVGRPYFDTTLGKPIWVKSTGPVVWVDATGAVV